MLGEYDLKRDLVEINRKAPQWSHNAVWNKRYMEPKPGFTLQQLWADSESAITQKTSPSYEVKDNKNSRAVMATVGRHRLGPEHVQNSTPETWSHPNTMRASGARALGGMFCNARLTHTVKLCTKNTGAKKQQCWDKKKLCWKCWGRKVCAGHASHTLAHCCQEMSTGIIADR